MAPANTEVSAVVIALHQAYYALYALLVRREILNTGELNHLLKMVLDEGFLEQESAKWLRNMADQIDMIDNGKNTDKAVNSDLIMN